jgi:hypothetical protein
MLNWTLGPLQRAFVAWEYSLQQNMKRKSNYKCNQEETNWFFLQKLQPCLLEKIRPIETFFVNKFVGTKNTVG